MPGNDEGEERGQGRRVHRRGFFLEGFRQFIGPLADAVADRASEALEREPALPGGSPPPAPVYHEASGPVLRPPGALPEEEFLSRCLSSGRCVSACPVAAIRLSRSLDPRRDRKPFVDPDLQACVVCDDLSCMKACPTGALARVERHEIRMGLAALREDICVRSAGEDCQICVDKCPLGPQAIALSAAGRVEVRSSGCTGCGVCEMYCPTDPRAIVVTPSR